MLPAGRDPLPLWRRYHCPVPESKGGCHGPWGEGTGSPTWWMFRRALVLESLKHGWCLEPGVPGRAGASQARTLGSGVVSDGALQSGREIVMLGVLRRSHTDEQTSQHPRAGLPLAGKELKLQATKSGRRGTCGVFPGSAVPLLTEMEPACLRKLQGPYQCT